MSAYVYGTLLALAAVVVVDPHAIEDGSAVLIVLGTTATTFLAHVFAEIVAYRAIGDVSDRTDHVRARAAADELRDAVPIASSGALPAVLPRARLARSPVDHMGVCAGRGRAHRADRAGRGRQSNVCRTAR